MKKGMGFILMFVVWTMLIQVVDVQAIGPNGAEVGFATMNGWFHKLTDVHMTLYTLTDWLGLIPVFVCIIFGGVGFVQLVKRRRICKVDIDIIFLGIYYLIVIASYLLFEMLPINYRPILIEGRMEASYPSSTTLLVLCVMPTLIEQINRRMKNAKIRKLIVYATTVFSIFMVFARLISGVHWFTDIIGAIILSVGLFLIYQAAVIWIYKDKHQQGGFQLWNFMKNFRN